MIYFFFFFFWLVFDLSKFVFLSSFDNGLQIEFRTQTFLSSGQRSLSVLFFQAYFSSSLVTIYKQVRFPKLRRTCLGIFCFLRQAQFDNLAGGDKSTARNNRTLWKNRGGNADRGDQAVGGSLRQHFAYQISNNLCVRLLVTFVKTENDLLRARTLLLFILIHTSVILIVIILTVFGIGTERGPCGPLSQFHINIIWTIDIHAEAVSARSVS